MWQIKKSRLFIQQLCAFTTDYNERAGTHIASQFVDAVEQALAFISENPMACSKYHPGIGYEYLLEQDFRKWPLKKFPYSIFFRVKENQSVIIEIIYAHKMDIIGRLPKDIP